MRRKGVQRLREVLTPKSAEREYKEVSNVSYVTTHIARGPIIQGAVSCLRVRKGRTLIARRLLLHVQVLKKKLRYFTGLMLDLDNIKSVLLR